MSLLNSGLAEDITENERPARRIITYLLKGLNFL